MLIYPTQLMMLPVTNRIWVYLLRQYQSQLQNVETHDDLRTVSYFSDIIICTHQNKDENAEHIIIWLLHN